MAVVLVFAAVFVVRNWDGIVDGLRRLTVLDGVVAMVAIGVGLVGSALTWRSLLAGLGSPLPVPVAARVFLLGQIGKYVPGSVWPIVAQAEMSREHGVPRARAAFASLLQMVVALVTGVVVAAACLAVSAQDALRTYWWLLLVAVAGAVVLVPPVFERLLGLALRLLRRPGSARLPGRALASAGLWSALMWVAFGTQMWVLARTTGSTDPRLWLLSTGAYALAWCVGFVIVFLPAGAGAREAVLVLVLGPAVGREQALALALVGRALMLVADLAAAALAVLAERRHRRRAGLPARPTADQLTGGTGSP